jgi:hypothetical protein
VTSWPELMTTAPGTATGKTTGTVGEAVDSLLVFLTTSCVSCRDHWEALAGAPIELAPEVRLVVVTPSRSMEDELLARRLAPTGAYLHMSSDTWFMYGVGQAGTVVLVRSRAGAPPPWAEAGQVLGSAFLAEPGGMLELVRAWQQRGAP